MANRGGCAVEGPTDWSRAAFANLGCLPQSERARWCVWKSVELLYLLSTQDEQGTDTLPGSMPDRNITRLLAEISQYTLSSGYSFPNGYACSAAYTGRL